MAHTGAPAAVKLGVIKYRISVEREKYGERGNRANESIDAQENQQLPFNGDVFKRPCRK